MSPLSALHPCPHPQPPKPLGPPCPVLGALQRPRPLRSCSHLSPWKSHSFSLCWGHASGGSQHKNSVTPNPTLDVPSSTQRHTQLSMPQGQSWAQPAMSLLVSLGRRRVHPVSLSPPTHGAAHRASPNRDSPCWGLFSATQSPGHCACRAKGSRDMGWHAPNLGERGETP